MTDDETLTGQPAQISKKNTLNWLLYYGRLISTKEAYEIVRWILAEQFCLDEIKFMY